MTWEVDHLVVGAANLDEGATWCRATFGAEPASGGPHPLMGTHNRLLAIGGSAFPRSYLEIIAIDPQAPPPGRPRWFDLDDAGVQNALALGPALLHWVARSTDLAADCIALAALGIERGDLLAAERAAAQGLLRWRISVRADGARLYGGALPTLIEWSGALHPAQALPQSGVELQKLSLSGLPEALRMRLPAGVDRIASDTGPALLAAFTTPRGTVELAGDVPHGTTKKASHDGP